MRCLSICLLVPLFSVPQAPALSPSDRALAALAERCPNGGPEPQEALRAAIEADYGSAWRVHAALEAGVARTVLQQALRLEEVQAAELVVSGRIARVETIQGGVIDYHTLVVHFEQPEFVRGTAQARAEIAQHGSVAVLRGSSWDTWLAATLRRDLERISEPRTFVFTRSELKRVHTKDARERGVEVLEYTTLPAAAASVLR